MKKQQIKILVIDDSRMMLRMLQKILSNLGFNNVDICTDPQSEILLLKNNKQVDFIFVDFMMDGLDGIEFVKEARHALGNDVPIIMISSKADQEHIKKAFKSGVNDYIVKPFTQEIILAHMNKFLIKSTKDHELIGQKLIQKQLINEEQLEHALFFQKTYTTKQMKLSHLMLINGYVSLEQLVEALDEFDYDDKKCEGIAIYKKWINRRSIGRVKKEK